MEALKKFMKSDTAKVLGGVLIGTVAGAYVRKVPYLSKLPSLGQ